MRIRPVGDELFLVYGWTGKHDEADCHFSQFCDVPKNGVKAGRNTQPGKVTQCHSLAAMNCDVKVTYGRRSVIVTVFVVHHKETL
jgi:hypothetical protein